jgi:hypothetical protein
MYAAHRNFEFVQSIEFIWSWPQEFTRPGGTSFASAIAGSYSRFGALEETEFLGFAKLKEQPHVIEDENWE